jgi:hypothetical protein
MASKKPVVIGDDGKLQNIQPTDTLNAPIDGVRTRSLTNGESSAALIIGTPVYLSAADTAKRAQANATGTSKVIGVWYDASISAGSTGYAQLDGVLVATTGQWDAVTGGSGGLIFNTDYWLDSTTAGKLTSTVPTTTGHSLVLVGTALSATELQLKLNSPILL